MWKKHCSRSGVRGDIEEGYFEEISNNNIGNVWRRLLSQKPLSKDTVDENLLIAAEAWAMGRAVPQDDPVYVFGSDVDTEALADEALRRWVKAFFL
mmetsp:Transcript_2970/g.6423  ORF Transcript_2970/g.6423 Transcript_2970/m.6423 type:complete len:96 (-) Transcript_2970:156-443(-)